MGITPAQWLLALPRAVGPHALSVQESQALVQIGSGRLVLQWQVLPPRQIALLNMPRMGVRFAFEGVNEAERLRFMRYFDLSTQRGGG